MEPLKGKLRIDEFANIQQGSLKSEGVIQTRSYLEDDVASAVKYLKEEIRKLPNPMGLTDHINKKVDEAFPDVTGGD